MSRKTLSFLLSLTLAAAASAVSAATPQGVSAAFQKQTGLTPESVRKTPVKGIWEVVVQERIVYTDETGRYAFSGALIETASGTNLTNNRFREIARDRLKTLPLKDAVTQVFGKGERKLIVFSDANCTYCRVMERAYVDVGNLTVHTFITPMLRGDENAREIVCARNPVKAWTGWMKQGVRPLPVAADCDSSVLERNALLAHRFGVKSVPTIFFPSGDRFSGALTAEQLSEILRKM